MSDRKLGDVGFFISFEGVEGSGKSTQLELLARHLEKKGHRVVRTKEPGGTELGFKIRRILLDSLNCDTGALAELFLYEAARVQHVEQVILLALEKADVVLCDRFTDSTIAYQGFGRGLDIRLLERMNKLASCSVKPDLTILLDLDVEIGIERASKRIEAASKVGDAEDRFENLPLDFHRKVRRGYLEIAAKEPERIVVVEAQGSPDGVHSLILAHIEKILPKKGQR